MSTQLLRNGLSGIFIVESIQLGLLQKREGVGEERIPTDTLGLWLKVPSGAQLHREPCLGLAPGLEKASSLP